MNLTLPCEAIASHPDFRRLDSIAGIRTELRYAGPDNFVGRNLYGDLDCGWLHRHAAAGLEIAVAWLSTQHPGYTLLVLDALRPHRIQQQLWDHLAGTELRQYLADPARGSIHSFGMAVDVTLLDADGHEVDMGTGFDDLSIRSHPALEMQQLATGELLPAHITHRHMLRQAMLDSGFHGIHSEWWHFDFGEREEVRRRYLRID